MSLLSITDFFKNMEILILVYVYKTVVLNDSCYMLKKTIGQIYRHYNIVNIPLSKGVTTSPGLPCNKTTALEVSRWWHQVCSHDNMTIHTGMNSSTEMTAAEARSIWSISATGFAVVIRFLSLRRSNIGTVVHLWGFGWQCGCSGSFLQWKSLGIVSSNRVIIFMSLLETRCCCLNHRWGFWRSHWHSVVRLRCLN